MSGPNPELKKQILQQAQGAAMLNVAFIGVANGLFDQLVDGGSASSDELAVRSGRDRGYVERWADAAFAFGLLDDDGGRFAPTELGRAFARSTPGNAVAMAVQAVLGAHMAERAATLMKSGERPGEAVLAERESILPLFGPMLELTFGPMFEEHILPNVPVFKEVNARGGVAVDLGCGNGWYLRKLVKRCADLRGVGLDGFDENIRQARALAASEGTADRLEFKSGDLHRFSVDEPVDLIAMNRALHHVWSEKDNVFRILKEHLKPGGAAVIWEPAWPAERAALRDPSRRGMAFQNLSEHVQGNHFLRPEEIAQAFEAVGMKATVHRFLNDNEAVVVGERR